MFYFQGKRIRLTILVIYVWLKIQGAQLLNVQWMLYQEFLEKFIIIKICRQNIFKKNKEKEGIVLCPLCLFNLTFLLLKCYRSLMRLCCQFFSSSKLFYQILFFFMHSLQTEEIKLYEAAYFFVDLCTYNRKSL